MLILRSRRDDSGTNLGGGGNELGDLVQAVQMRNQLQPQVDLRTREGREAEKRVQRSQRGSLVASGTVYSVFSQFGFNLKSTV